MGEVFRKHRGFFLIALMLVLVFGTEPHSLAGIPITILHTNDLHSHYVPEKDALQLGGIARLKTAIDRVRNSVTNSLLVDGGDWSEGQIFYTDGIGGEALRLMDEIGYDAAVVGNHDWLNGPDVLLDTLLAVRPRLSLVSANLDSSLYSRGKELKVWIPPFTIREINGVKIALIGLSTYEYIYDKFFAPVKILEPISIARTLATQLKKEVDAVIVISHHSLSKNQTILQRVGAIDLIIGAHDHQLLRKPVVVNRSGRSPAWVVEAGEWGQYLGRVDLEISHDVQRDHRVKLLNYQLIQIDPSIPENPAIAQRIEEIKSKVQTQFGPVFDDHIGHSDMEFNRLGIENRMGNLVTDAYLRFSQADFAMDSTKFIYGQIHEGPIHTADVFNSNPAVYNPKTGKAWTLKVLPISGRLLKGFLDLMYATHKLSGYGLLNFSGMSFTYSPFFLRSQSVEDELSDEGPRAPGLRTLGFFDILEPVRDVMIQGKPIDVNKTYRVATGGGIIEGIEIFNSYSPFPISLKNLEDTGVENWRVLADYIQAHSPLHADSLHNEVRIRTKQSDLGVFYEDVNWQPISRTPEGTVANIHVRVRNYGNTSSLATNRRRNPSVHIYHNRNGVNYSVEPDLVELGESRLISDLSPTQFEDFTWQVTLPADRGLYPVTVKIQDNESETNHTDDEVTRWFVAG